MKRTWKLQDAKAKFSQLVDEAIKKGPQFVTRHGNKAVVVVSATDFDEIVSSKPPLIDFLLKCPRSTEALDLDRQKDPPRDLAL